MTGTGKANGDGRAGTRTTGNLTPRKRGMSASALAGKTTKKATRKSAGAGQKVDKVSVSMPPETVRTVREMAAAAEMSVSAWLTRAAEESAERARRVATAQEAAAEYAAEVEAMHGQATPEEQERVDAFFAELAAYTRGAYDQAA